MSEEFDWKFYLDYYKDITRPCITKNQIRCFRHYKKFGKFEGKKFTKINQETAEEAPNMNWQQYIKDYPDLMVEVERNERGATFHWKKIGKNENRLCNGNMLRDNIRKCFKKILEREATVEDVEMFFIERVQGRNEDWLINELENSEEKKKLDKKKMLEKRRVELDSVEKMVNKCFKEILERRPDTKTLNFYSDQVFLGMTEKQIIDELNNSEEKRDLIEKKNKKKKKKSIEFIKKNYFNILNRSISKEDLEVKVKFLMEGNFEERQDLIVDELLSSDERFYLDQEEARLDKLSNELKIDYNINLILKKDLLIEIMKRKNFEMDLIEERKSCLESMFLGFNVSYYLQNNTDVSDKDWKIEKCLHHIVNFGKYDSCYLFQSIELCRKFVNSINYVLNGAFYQNEELSNQLFNGCISIYDIFNLLKNKPFSREIIHLDTSNVKLKKSNNSFLKNKKVLVQGLCKNISKNFINIKKFYNDLKKNTKKTCLYYLESNSDDNSSELLSDFSSTENNFKGQVKFMEDSEEFKNLNRSEFMSLLRNYCHNNSLDEFDTDFDYLIVVDLDFLNTINIKQIMSCDQLNEEWDIITGNAKYQKSDIYYDSFCLRFDNNDSIEKNYKYSEDYCKNFNWLDKVYIFNSWQKVNHAFGGLSLFNLKKNNHLLQKDIYELKMNVYMCEHIPFQVKNKLNNVYVNPNIHIEMKSKFIDSQYPITRYIPRDSGFCAVFNFYIGALMNNNINIYPDWRYYSFFNETGEPRHFCYFNTNNKRKNTWNEYFEPITFLNNDTVDIEKVENITDCTKEANIVCKKQKELAKLIHSNKYDEWRKKAHLVYKRYIKMNSRLTSLIERDSKEFTDKMIGVHYRHPSKSCEIGEVYLNDYFKKLDNILIDDDYKIFLATDTDFGLLAFKSRYGDKIIYTKNIDRLPLDNILEWAYAGHNKGKMDNVGFIEGKGYELQHIASENRNLSTKLGDDILSDVFCLSKCKYLIHPISNISLMVSYINPNIEMLCVSKLDI